MSRAAAEGHDALSRTLDASALHLVWSGLAVPPAMAENAALSQSALDGAVDAGGFGDPGDLGDMSDGLDI